MSTPSALSAAFTRVVLATICLTGALPSNGWAQGISENVKASFRDASTHDDLAPVYQQSIEQDPIRLLGQDPEILAAAKGYSQESLIDRSQILSHGGQMTLVPKGAILLTPAYVADRLQVVEGAKIVSWPEFYQKNSHWIQPLGVKLEQAIGDEPLDPSLLSRLAKSGKVIVATYFDHPISIRPDPVKTETETPASEEP